MLEIHAGEGGQDAQDFVFELASIYLKYADHLGLEKEILHSSEARITLWFKGARVQGFADEGGKHVIQRVPHSGKGKRHTSVVGVAVMPIMANVPKLDMKDVEWEAMIGRGPGGQNRNKVASTVRMVHKPTGITVVINERDQSKNRTKALKILSNRVHEYHSARTTLAYNRWRDQQLDGNGRGNKIRTYSTIRDEVKDHRTGKTVPFWEVEKGILNGLR